MSFGGSWRTAMRSAKSPGLRFPTWSSSRRALMGKSRGGFRRRWRCAHAALFGTRNLRISNLLMSTGRGRGVEPGAEPRHRFCDHPRNGRSLPSIRCGDQSRPKQTSLEHRQKKTDDEVQVVLFVELLRAQKRLQSVYERSLGSALEHAGKFLSRARFGHHHSKQGRGGGPGQHLSIREEDRLDLRPGVLFLRGRMGKRFFWKKAFGGRFEQRRLGWKMFVYGGRGYARGAGHVFEGSLGVAASLKMLSGRLHHGRPLLLSDAALVVAERHLEPCRTSFRSQQDDRRLGLVLTPLEGQVNHESMSSPKTIVMTGASSGIGLEASRLLTDAGHRVIAGVRREVQLPGVEARPLDLSSLASVEAFGAACPPIDVLIANAGLQVVSQTQLSSEGFELSFAVNHLAHLALIHHLRGKMRPGARIVLTISGTHNPEDWAVRLFGFRGGLYTGVPRLAAGDVGEERSPRLLGMDRYATSKLANVMTVVELARRASVEEVAVLGFDPGLVPATNLVRDQPPLLQRLYRWLTPLLERLPGASSPVRSGASLAWMATDEALRGKTGAFFDYRRRPARIWSKAFDPALGSELVDESLVLMKLPQQELQGGAPSTDSETTPVHRAPSA